MQEPFKKPSLKSGCTPHPSAPSQGSSLLFDALLQHSHGDRTVRGPLCPTHGSQRDTERICIKCFTSLAFHGPPKSTSVTPWAGWDPLGAAQSLLLLREGWTGLQESGMALGWAGGELSEELVTASPEWQ